MHKDQCHDDSGAAPDFSAADTGLIAPPDMYFRSVDNFVYFWQRTRMYAESSRLLPQQTMESLQTAMANGERIAYPVPDWDCLLKAACCREVRMLLEHQKTPFLNPSKPRR